MRHGTNRSAVAVTTAVIVTAISVVAGGCAAGGGTSRATSKKPNILFVLTDDLDAAEVSVMPNLRSQLAAQGTTFSNAFVSVSLCCPSRSTILRGQYSHNTGVETNGGTNGGFETAHAQHIEDSTIGTWLHGAGYRTALIGKYLNGYPHTVARTYVPPGWDEWDSASGGNPYSEYNYTLNENGKLVRYGHAPADYGTDVYANKTKDFVTRAAHDHKPFFAYLAVYAPHQPATPAPADVGRFANAQAPHTPAYDEADVTDKPQWVQTRSPLSPMLHVTIDRLYRKRLESLQAVDRAIGELVSKLRQNGQLDNTYIVFTSDNGFHLGQHRLPPGKQTAYDTDIHVPLVVRGPRVAAAKTVSDVVGNVDFAPTFAALAGAITPDFVDGRSLVPLLRSSDGARSHAPSNVARAWRRSYLVEHWGEQARAPGNAGGAPLEPADPGQVSGVRASRAGGSAIPEYHGIRTGRFTYVEYVTGERELYDVSTDPDELVNLALSTDPTRLAAFHGALASLVACRATACRTSDTADPGG